MNIEIYPLEKVIFDGTPVYLGMEQFAVESIIGKGQLIGKRYYYFNNEMAIDYSQSGTVEFIEFLGGIEGTLRPVIYEVSAFDVEADELGIKLTEEWTNLFAEGYYERQVWEIKNNRSSVVAQFINGTPAIVETPCGEGRFISIATYLWYGYHCQKREDIENVAKIITEKFYLRKQCSDMKEVKVGRLKGEEGELIIVFNYTKEQIDTIIQIEDVSETVCEIENLYDSGVIGFTQAGTKVRFQSKLHPHETTIYRLKTIKK